MSTFELSEATTWAGRPVARRVRDALPRTRVVISGRICATHLITLGHSRAYCCTLSDGTGVLDLVFLGRCVVPGLAVGRRCRAEGTARVEGGRLVVWNPLYQLEAADQPMGAGLHLVEGPEEPCRWAKGDARRHVPAGRRDRENVQRE